MTNKLMTGLLLGAAIAFAGSAQAQDIKIALAGPITGSEATFGAQMKAGAEQWVKDQNAAGGLLGRKIALQLEDDKCDGTEATSVANRIASSGVVFVAGHFCSGSSIPASAIYQESGIVQISPASTNPKFTDQRPGPGIYRVCGRDDQQGPTAAKFIMEKFKGKKVAFLNDKSPYGEGLAVEAQKAYEKAGGKPVLVDSFNKGDTDFSALVSKLKQAGADLVYYRHLPHRSRQPGEAAPPAGREGSGHGRRRSRQPGVLDHRRQGRRRHADDLLARSGEGQAKNAAIVKKFTDAGIKPEGYVLYTYAAMQAWADAVKTAGGTDHAKVVKALDDGKFATVIGPIDFDAKGDVTLPGYVMYQWKANGTYDYVE